MLELIIFFQQELRVLKNFSSLKAIISGLQSNPVYRLRRTWQSVAREKLEIFEELVSTLFTIKVSPKNDTTQI